MNQVGLTGVRKLARSVLVSDVRRSSEKGRGLCAACFVACSVVVCGLVVKPVVHKLEKVYCIVLFELS